MVLLRSHGAGDALSSLYNGAISKSLRFPAETGGGHLNRTFSNNNTSNDWTFSTWVKRSSVDVFSAIFYASSTSSTYYFSGLSFQASGTIRYYHASNMNNPPGGTNIHNDAQSTKTFRDPAAWYHVVCQRDNDGNTVIYVNGTQVASGSSSSHLYYANGTSYPHYLGQYTYQSNPDGYFHGYLGDTHFVDNALVAPTVFAETSNGVWIPIKNPNVSDYGDNGFRLEYKGTGTATSSGSVANPTNIGDDSSGKNNHWAVSTLTSHDVMPDTPENNFATLNPSIKGYYDLNFGQGCLEVIGNGSAGDSTYSINQATMACHMKSYWEVKVQVLTDTGRTGSGLLSEGAHQDLYGSLSTADMAPVAVSHAHGTSNFTLADSNVFTDGESSSQGQIVMWAFDPNSGKVWYGVDGTWAKSGNPATGSNPNTTLSTDLFMLPAVHVQSSSDNCIFNFGQDGTFAGTETAQNNSDGNGYGNFYYAPPSGFLALCTANLPEPLIGPNSTTNCDDHFDISTWTGANNATQSVTSYNLKGDLLWAKRRDSTGSHYLYDSTRGANKSLSTDTTSAEDTTASQFTEFTATGFNLPADNAGYINYNARTYVGWNWKIGGGSPSSYQPTGASASVTMQRNTTAGISMIRYLGSGTGVDAGDQVLGHGLQVNGVDTKPDMMIFKAQTIYGSVSWAVWDKDLGGNLDTDFLLLGSTNGTKSNSDNIWGGTSGTYGEPTTTLAYIGYDWNVNKGSNVDSGNTAGYYMGYFFASVEGYSKFGKYFGNGNVNGTYVYTGFRPRFVLWKQVSGDGEGWYIFDAEREPNNNMIAELMPDANNGESGSAVVDVDFFANGFKLTSDNANANQDGQTFIYAAFAEMPFKYANAR